MEGKMIASFGLQNVGYLDKNLYVGRPSNYSTIPTAEIVAYAAKAANISQSTLLTTLSALYDAFNYYLCNGHSFKLDGIGTFSLSMSAATADPTAADIVSGADAVKTIGINFLADKEIKALVSAISWSVEAKNTNNLVEFTEFLPTKVALDGDSANLLDYDSTEGHYCGTGAQPVVYGWNVPETFKMQIDGYDASGNEISQEFSMVRTEKKMCIAAKAEANATIAFARITKISVDGEEYEYTGDPSEAASNFAFGSTIVANGSVVNYGTDTLTVSGKNLSSKTVYLDGTALAASSKSSTLISISNVALAIGSHTLKCGDTEVTFTAVDGDAVNVLALTANGTTVANGDSSTMISGESYTMVATGQNLNKLSVTDITVPSGCTVSGFSAQSDGTRLQFTVVYGGTAGDIKIGSYFTVGVTTATPAATITSIGGIANGGTLTASAFGSAASPQYYAIVGENYSDCTVSAYNAGTGDEITGFSISGSNLLEGTGKEFFQATVYIKQGDTTVFSFTYNQPN